jgi:hypothetical protein
MRTLVLLLALLPLVTACKKELGELCSDGSECETELCRVVPPGSDAKICALDSPCPDAVDIDGECIRPCSAGCPEGTVIAALAFASAGFFTASGKKPFVHRIIVSTTDLWSEHAEDALRDQQVPVNKIDLSALEKKLPVLRQVRRRVPDRHGGRDRSRGKKAAWRTKVRSTGRWPIGRPLPRHDAPSPFPCTIGE